MPKIGVDTPKILSCVAITYFKLILVNTELFLSTTIFKEPFPPLHLRFFVRSELCKTPHSN